MIGLLIAAALAQATGAPSAPDPCHAVPRGHTRRSCPPWHSVWRAEEFEVFTNPASVVRSRGTFEVSLRIVYVADQENRLRSGVSRYRYDCASRTNVTLHVVAYDSAGSVIEERDAIGDETEPESSSPGSPGEAMLAEYCPH